ncbi:MAG TPA: ATPase [Novosphingobium sp.]|nr:ATPase [Novosphingobium sp.]HZV09922.1 ATPase [Novosphingobium sp.]
MPQIAQLSETYASQIFWLLLFFGFTFFVVGRGMVPKVMATVASREARIAEDLAAAEAARIAAEQDEVHSQRDGARQRAEAQAVIAKAKHDAALATEARLAEAAGKVDGRIAEADARIAHARAAALGEIETVAAEAASDIASKIAGLSVDAGQARAAVKEILHG